MAKRNSRDKVKIFKDWIIRSEVSFISYKKEKRSETIWGIVVKY